VIYTVFEDGNTLETVSDAVRIFWSNGHYTHYHVIPGFYRGTYRRVR